MIIGYDIDKQLIEKAQLKLNNIHGEEIYFIHSFKNLKKHFSFDSCSANFVFHEEPLIIQNIYYILPFKSKLCILDDCFDLGERVGFKTIKPKTSDKYFIWVGEKSSEVLSWVG